MRHLIGLFFSTALLLGDTNTTRHDPCSALQEEINTLEAQHHYEQVSQIVGLMSGYFLTDSEPLDTRIKLLKLQRDTCLTDHMNTSSTSH